MKTERSVAWLELAQRHVDMGRRLVDDYPDGAFFHAYHAFECGVSAALLDLLPHEPLPAGHSDKIVQLLDRAGEGPAVNQASELWPHLDRRNESLYIGWRRDAVRRPQDLFTSEAAELALDQVQTFVEEVGRG